ncbi:MAG: lyase family protein, partial [Acidimicrobiales bacterium]
MEAAAHGHERIERDTMGEVRVPASARWGAQTQRAVQNFPVSGLRMGPDLIHALARIKAAAAAVNGRLGVIGTDAAEAIAAAADEVAAGIWDDQFPVDVYQTGSGTSSNMNINEVLASLAGERLGRRVHPNDEVNASQSSNDVFPSAVRLAAATGLVTGLVPALEHLAVTLRTKS